jgi:S-methylmethionine-dependent homocysteine/selenocysteine methylase
MSARDRLNERLAAGEVVLIDGGMGSELQARGVPMDRAAWSALANLDHLSVVQQIHEDNIRAGAEVIIANTYPASRLMLRGAGSEDRFEETNRRAVEAAMAARDATDSPDVAIAGSISVGVANDFMLREQSSLEGQALRDAFKEQAETLADAGVDLLTLEMMMAPWHGIPAVETAIETGLPVWLGISTSLSPEGEAVALGSEGGSLDDLLEALLRPELAAVTVMHSTVEATGPSLEAVRNRWSGPLGAYPESGGWTPPTWIFSDLSPVEFADTALGWVRSKGVQIIGGCCGMGPDYIEAIRAALAKGGASDS